MAVEAAKLIVEISADISKLQSGLKTSSNSLTSFSKSMLKVGSVLTGAITVPAVAAAKQIFNVGASFEQSRIAFETMLGSGKEAEKFLKDLRDFAARTPFEFVELQDAAKRMMAFGFSAKQVIPMLTSIGDAAAGLGIGSEGVQRITLALGQMQAKTKVSAQEMMQLTEAGVPAWKYLAQAMGMSTSEVMKLAEKGLIPADKAIRAILDGMSKDFGGLMAKQSQTALGALSNLSDELNALALDLSQALLPTAKELIATAREAVAWFSALPDNVKTNIVQFVGLAAAVGPVLVGISGLTSGISNVIKIGKGISTVIGGASTAIKAFRSGLSLTSALGAAGLSPIAITLGAIALAAGSVVAVWAQWNKQIVQTNREGVKAVKSAWGDFFEKQIAAGKSATEVLNEYRAAQQRIQETLKINFKEGGISEVAKLFVDKKALMQAGAEELSNALLRASTSYTEYVKTMKEAGLEERILSQTEYILALKKSLDETSQSVSGLSSSAGDLGINLESISAAAQNQVEELNNLIQRYDDLKAKMDDWLKNTASEVHSALGEKFGESTKTFRDAISIVDQELGTNYTEQLKLKDAVKALVDQYARTKDLDAFREGLKKIKDEGLADTKTELENVTQKAQELYNQLLSLPEEIKIRINFDVQELPDWIKQGAKTSSTTTSSESGYSRWGRIEERALGGPVYAGKLYLVGERGPELFIPRQSGTIVPNATSGMTIQNVQVIFRDTAFTPESFGNALKQLEWMYS